MKKFVTYMVMTVLLGAVTLSCGPGNGSAPYKGGFFLTLSQRDNVDTTLTSANGAQWIIRRTATVLDADGNPVPNIAVNVFLEVNEITLQSYADFIGDPFTLLAEGETAVMAGALIGSIDTKSDYSGNVDVTLVIPRYFDGALSLLYSTANDSVFYTLTVTYDSGTSCTDGSDNDNNGVTDNGDPACPNGFAIEPTTGGGALTATQSPTGTIATGGSVSISTSGGTGPFTFSSADPLVATVGAGTGLVTAVAAGNTTITVTDNVGASVIVNIAVADAVTFSVSPTTITTTVGGTTQLVPSYQDVVANNLVGLQITYSTANAAIADVNVTGLVTGVAVGGPVNITVNFNDPGANTAVVPVTVN